MAIFFIIGSMFIACRSACSGERFHFCASAESATPLHAAPARPLGGLFVGRFLARFSRHKRPPTKPPRSRPPLGGSPKLLFLALPCLLFACLILPLLLADMRFFAFGKNSGFQLAVFPHAQSRIPPPALASVAWCQALGSLLSPIRPPPSALAPVRPLGGLPEITLFGATLLAPG